MENTHRQALDAMQEEIHSRDNHIQALELQLAEL